LRSLEALSDHVRPVEATDPWAEFLSQADWVEFLSAEKGRVRRYREHADWGVVDKVLAEAEPGTFPLAME
jgi:hypothetical protein